MLFGTAIGLVLGFLAGTILGKWVTEVRWRGNTKVPARVFSGNNFYKVVKLDDSWSWSCLSIHEDERPKENDNEFCPHCGHYCTGKTAFCTKGL